MSFYVCCHQYALPTFRMGLPASNNLMKIVPHRSAWWLGLWLFPDAVQLLAKTKKKVEKEEVRGPREDSLV